MPKNASLGRLKKMKAELMDMKNGAAQGQKSPVVSALGGGSKAVDRKVREPRTAMSAQKRRMGMGA